MSLEFVQDRHKTQGMCNEEVQKKPYLVEYVANGFALQGQLKILDDYKGFCNNFMIPLIRVMMVIKNARLKKQRLRRSSCLLHGIPIM